MEIKGTSAVITGGASGLGAATARLLASYGVYVTLIDLNDTLGEAVASEVNGASVRGDVRDEADVIRAVETAIEMAPLSCTVNAAGVGLAVRTVGRDGRFESTVVNLTRELGCQWAKDSVRVNAIAPGYFPSEFMGEQEGEAKTVAFLERSTPMGRMGKSGELDGALLFLASQASSYCTGTTLVVDGGWTAR